MKRYSLGFIALLSLAACGSQDGRYEPSCVAYEGDTIDLRGGRFKWSRFTDQRQIDDNGNVVEPFPDFPKTGKVQFDNGRLVLVSDEDVRLADWYSVELDGNRYLLTVSQHSAYTESRALPNCALRFTPIDR